MAQSFRIESDGFRDTKIFDAETGTPIKGVYRIEWTAEVDGAPHAKIFTWGEPFSATAFGDVFQKHPACCRLCRLIHRIKSLLKRK